MEAFLDFEKDIWNSINLKRGSKKRAFKEADLQIKLLEAIH